MNRFFCAAYPPGPAWWISIFPRPPSSSSLRSRHTIGVDDGPFWACHPPRWQATSSPPPSPPPPRPPPSPSSSPVEVQVPAPPPPQGQGGQLPSFPPSSPTSPSLSPTRISYSWGPAPALWGFPPLRSGGRRSFCWKEEKRRVSQSVTDQESRALGQGDVVVFDNEM